MRAAPDVTWRMDTRPRGGRAGGGARLDQGRWSTRGADVVVVPGNRQQAVGDDVIAHLVPHRLPGGDVEAPVDAGVDAAVARLLCRRRETGVRARRARQAVGAE